MSLRLIRFLVAALALAVPLQGMAAVIVGQCMALAHHSDAAGDTGHGVPQDGHGHASHIHAHDGAEDGTPDGADNNGSHCGACTASASIAGPAGLSIVSRASSAPYVFAQFAPPSVPLDVLDRPPTAL